MSPGIHYGNPILSALRLAVARSHTGVTGVRVPVSRRFGRRGGQGSGPFTTFHLAAPRHKRVRLFVVTPGGATRFTRGGLNQRELITKQPEKRTPQDEGDFGAKCVGENEWQTTFVNDWL
jgi:hypothetical protein